MSKFNENEMNRYIDTKAREAIRSLYLKEGDYRICGSPMQFADIYYQHIFRWVNQHITNPETLAKVIMCAMSTEEVNLQRDPTTRFFSLGHVMRPKEEYYVQGGRGALVSLAAYTICAAICDQFRLEEEKSFQSDMRSTYGRPELGPKSDASFYH